MMAQYQIVSTRLLSDELVHQLQAIGISVTQHDFISTRIQLPKNILRSTIQNVVILTSKTAVKAWMQIIASWQLRSDQYRIYCLSEGTQNLVLSNGLVIAGTATNSASLADEILSDKNIRNVTLVCGNRRRDELPDKLKSGGVAVHEIVAYTTELTPIAISVSMDGILFYSPSGVESFLAKNSVGSAVAFCLGQTTAEYALKMGFNTTRIAEAHTPSALVKAVLDYYSNKTIHA